MKALPIGCARCGATRRDHDATDHRWQAPSIPLMRERAAAWRKQVAA